MKQQSKKKDKKKIIVIALFLFAVLALGGYGAYSYYWTEGNFSGSTSVEVTAFDPETTIDNSSNFLGSGGTLHISCPDSTTGNEELTCTGSVEVTNNGGTPITVDVFDGSSSEYEAYNLNVNPSSPSFNWTEATLSAGESKTLNISVPARVVSDYGSSSPVQTTSPYEGGHVNVAVHMKLRATQVH